MNVQAKDAAPGKTSGAASQAGSIQAMSTFLKQKNIERWLMYSGYGYQIQGFTGTCPGKHITLDLEKPQKLE